MERSRVDLLIQGGQVMDGSGSPPRQADVALVGDRIGAVGDLADRPAAQRLDARGSVVCPGFIDGDRAGSVSGGCREHLHHPYAG